MIVLTLLPHPVRAGLGAEDLYPNCQIAYQGIQADNWEKEFNAFRSAVLANQASEVAKYLRFPFRLGAPRAIVRNASEFAKRFGTIFTPRVREELEDYRPRELQCDVNGIRLSGERLWFDVTHDERIRVKSIRP